MYSLSYKIVATVETTKILKVHTSVLINVTYTKATYTIENFLASRDRNLFTIPLLMIPLLQAGDIVFRHPPTQYRAFPPRM